MRMRSRHPRTETGQPKLINSERATESVWNTHLQIGAHKPPSSQRCALPQSPPVEGAVGGAGKETNGMPLARRRRARAGAPKRPQTIGFQRVKRPLISFLTFPLRYGRLWAVMQAALSDQGRARGRRQNEDGSRDGAGRAMARGRRGASSLPGKGKRGLEPRLPRLRGAWAGRSRVREAGSRMGKCSLMFAYVRLCSLYWRKMFEARL